MRLWIYTVEFQFSGENRVYTESGVCCGSCYTEATAALVELYGEEDLVAIETLYPIENKAICENDLAEEIMEGR